MNGDRLIVSGNRRQLSALQRAIEQFRTLVRPWRFRVQADAEGYPVILGRYGQIEWFDGQDLAVYSNRPRLFAKLWAIPGVRRHQTGDTEMRAVFPPGALAQVAAVIKARRRRQLSSGAARKLGAATAYRATSGGRERGSMDAEGTETRAARRADEENGRRRAT